MSHSTVNHDVDYMCFPLLKVIFPHVNTFFILCAQAIFLVLSCAHKIKNLLEQDAVIV